MYQRTEIPVVWKEEKFFWLAFFVLLLPWINFASHLAANSDNLWLAASLDKILSGGTMSRDAYELNPPSSLFTFLPAVLISKLGIPLANAITIFAMGAIALSVAVMARILRSWDFFSRREVAVMAAAFAVAQTILGSGTSLAERDQLIALVLVPFFMIQISLTYSMAWPKTLGRAVLFCGAFVILIKPHYALLPTLMLIHRAFLQRRLSVIKDPDFIALAVATVVSAGATWLWFSDWVTVILPDVLKLYVAIRSADVWKQTLVLVAIALAVGGTCRFFLPSGERRRVAVGLSFASLVCLVPFFVQGKGFFYHLFPFFGFLSLVIGMALYARVKKECGEKLAPFLCLLTVGFIAYATVPSEAGMFNAIIPTEDHYPTHSDYAALPLTRLISTCEGRGYPCTFFLFNNKMGLVQETAYYAHVRDSSRFPSYWFLPRIYDDQDKGISSAERGRLFHKYTLMAAADFERFHPKLVLIRRFDVANRPFSFVHYFSTEPAFSKAFAPYHFERTVTLNDHVYDMHSDQPEMTLDIFVRDDQK